MIVALVLAGGLAVALAALAAHHLARARRVPPARPRATLREALDETGDDVEHTVFPRNGGGWAA